MWNCCFQPTIEDWLPEHFPSRKANAKFVLCPKETPPKWEDDNDAIHCSKCQAIFDLFNRKHHCRSCGNVFCGGCASQFERAIKFGFVEPVRTCFDCLQQLRMENEFYECIVPVLEQGCVMVKQGLIFNREVIVKFDLATFSIKYQSTLGKNSVTGEIKSIELENIQDLKDIKGESSGMLGIMINGYLHKFDAGSEAVKQNWIKGLNLGINLYNLAKSREETKKKEELEQENLQMRMIAEDMLKFEQKRNMQQIERTQKNKQRRDELRRKYQDLNTSVA